MQDVLFLGRIEAGKLEFKPRPIALRGFCERVIDEMQSATARGGRIELHTVGELDGAGGDESLLRHILVNLLSNALKYSPEDSPVLLTVARAQSEAVFTVSDRGRGIPTEDQPILFRAFQRGSNVSDTPGTGLGLLLVHKCAEIHGGRIHFESAEERGTSFTYVFQKLHVEIRTAAALVAMEALTGGGASIT